MLRWAFAFFVLALIAALFGFSGLPIRSVGIVRGLFYGFLVMCLTTFVMGLMAGRRPAA